MARSRVRFLTDVHEACSRASDRSVEDRAPARSCSRARATACQHPSCAAAVTLLPTAYFNYLGIATCVNRYKRQTAGTCERTASGLSSNLSMQTHVYNYRLPYTRSMSAADRAEITRSRRCPSRPADLFPAAAAVIHDADTYADTT